MFSPQSARPSLSKQPLFKQRAKKARRGGSRTGLWDRVQKTDQRIGLPPVTAIVAPET